MTPTAKAELERPSRVASDLLGACFLLIIISRVNIQANLDASLSESGKRLW